ncbi:MAG: nuclear transport factor 2 family protein [Pseudomonadota bacterium]
MTRSGLFVAAASAALFSAGEAIAFDGDALRERFTTAFNGRDWASVRAMLADDVVFHRATGDTVFIGPDAVIARWEETIGNPGQWNVKFAILDGDSTFTGKDGRVVERGDFAVTAGGDDSACYRGSYLMTWMPDGDDWKLQMMGWQDVETDLGDCKA